MNALIVFNEKDTDNLFVRTLHEAIRRQGIDVERSTRAFWESNIRYDIIHFQWPEEVVGWNCTDPSIIEKLKQRIDHFRAGGSRFVYTRHNIRPHYCSNPIIGQAYDIIETNSDLTVHMGQFSLDEFRSRYPKSRNTLIPHHLYEHTYNEAISRQEARRQLGIPADRYVITSFGKFRDWEEIRMVLGAYTHLQTKKKYLLAPRMFPFSKHPGNSNPLKRLLSRIGYHLAMPLLNKTLRIKAGASEELISNESLPLYIAAADVIFVQRKQILNSGNVPLAFLFHKVAIGPQTGNVGELLRETGNPAFDAARPESIVRALEEAASLAREGQGERNHEYAIARFGTEHIGSMYAEAYRLLQNADH
ncbi:glycosyltransferase family 1 protein [Bacteroides fragilis]|uniref:glycosyltransferase family 1 protein n=1 Tax=Bacteroides fragilis TaxID=817 RepID=UPI001C7079D9|nr:glycosyltransferase family 1 protein [Bacteroides fragilis]MBW9276417.1 glycosyltransferase family 1 protein [Bacteroides fragilis]